jgi:ABC-type bacteriocin/lantibiotic exporter with double-glycine peptidase domain
VLQNLELVLDGRLIDKFMRHLVRLPLGFFLLRQPGDLIQRIESHAKLRSLLGEQLITTVMDVFLVLGYSALMLAYNSKLALLIIAIAGLQLVFQASFRRINSQVLSEELAATGRSSASILESLDAIETIKALGSESNSVGRWCDQTIHKMNTGVRRRKFQLLSHAWVYLATVGGTAAVFALAGREVIEGHMSVGTFSAFLLRNTFAND